MLEAQTAKALDQIKSQAAAALAKHEATGQAEADKTVQLTVRFDEAAQEVGRQACRQADGYVCVRAVVVDRNARQGAG